MSKIYSEDNIRRHNMNKQTNKKYDGTAIKQLRASLGISQSAFAALINADVRTIQMWEQGLSRPTTYTMFLLNEYVSRVLIDRLEG